MKAWPTLGILVVEAFLFLAHWFIFQTWIAFHGSIPPGDSAGLRIVVFVLAFSFIAAALLSYRFTNLPVRVFYKFAATWLGFLNFFFWASCLTWLIWIPVRYSGLVANPNAARPWIAGPLFALAIVICLYGALNALWIRTRKIRVKLPGLPEQWRGRTAVLLSDLHLGNINGPGFCRRMTAMAARYSPDVVFLPGDLFDGTKGELERLIAPLKELRPPFGIFYSTGNHEEFTSPDHYLDAVARSGVRNLQHELLNVEGLQIAGVSWHESTSPERMQAALDAMNLDRERASILLNHAPSRLPIVERAGFSLQLSGHTHGGQIFPFTWITRRIFGRFTHGLHNFGSLQVYTSTGAGTWGPPMRVRSAPEIVVMTFE